MKRICISLIGMLMLGFFQPMIALAEINNDNPIENLDDKNVTEDAPLTENVEEHAVLNTELDNSDNNISEVISEDEINPTTEKVAASPISETTLPVHNAVPAANNIASGIFGTSAWTIDSEGVLHIGAGEFADTPVNPGGGTSSSPWLSWRAQINKIIFEGPVVAANSLNNLFDYLANVTVIENIYFLDTSNTTTMQRVFGNCASLTSLDLTSWNTSKVTNLFSLFNGCTNMVSLDVSNWNTTSIKQMTYAFSGMPQLTTLDLSKWKVVLTGAQGIFMGNSSLTSLDLSGFDLRGMGSNPYAISRMFQNASSLKSIKLSANFRFYGTDTTNAELPSIVSNETYTGRWQNVGSGTVAFPKGKDVWTSNQFMNQFNDVAKDDVYVWQPVAVAAENVIVRYIDEEGTEIHAPQIISGGNIGEPFDTTTKAYQLAIDGYTLDLSQLPVNATGILSDQEQIVTYVYQKDQDFTEVNVHDSVIYIGDKWTTGDNFDSALDQAGNLVPFTKIIVDASQLDLNQAGIYEVIYRYGGVTSVAQITVKERLTAINVHDSVVYIGDKWTAEDNFDGALDKAGNPVAFNKIIMDDHQVDLNRVGVYEVFYHYDGITSTAQITVKEQETAVNVHDSTIYVGDNWKAEDNFDSAVDRAGNKLDFKDIKVMGTVDINQPGQYEVTYSYGGIISKAMITVAEKSEGKQQNDKPGTIGGNNTNSLISNDKSGKQEKTLPATGEQLHMSFTIIGLVMVSFAILKIRNKLFYK